MKKIVNLYKPVAMTPLQAVNKFKESFKEYKSKKISYPGRLDPMAEGVLLLLVGDENKKITQYMKLDKEYKAKILFGFQTDSYDILGIPKTSESQEDIKKLKKQIKSFKGKYKQTLPPYSSYKIKGKSLFHYARNNKLGDIELPNRTVEIKSITIDSIYTITQNKILKEIKKKISSLEGDFRQNEVMKEWEKLLENNKEIKHTVAEITISCSSGTYIRSIADDLNACLLNLIRTKVGNYEINKSLKLAKF